MPAERFYLRGELEGQVSLQGQELHHLAHVMRIRIGEEVELVNGRGSLARAKLKTLSKQEALFEVLECHTTPLPPPRLKIAIPLMRPAKLELVIEKCTELGTDAFYLYPAHFSEKEELSPHQFERFQHIAISAMKQCGRLDLPHIQEVGFEEILSLPGALLFGDPRATAPAKEVVGELVFITGPEKGFSEREIEKLETRAVGVRLHKNILRAETAPIVAAVLYEA